MAKHIHVHLNSKTKDTSSAQVNEAKRLVDAIKGKLASPPEMADNEMEQVLKGLRSAFNWLK